MRKRRLLWQLYPSYLLITLASLLAVGWFAFRLFEQSFMASVRDELELQARVVDRLIGPDFSASQGPRLRELCANIDSASSIRVTLILPTGQVISDSESNPDAMDNHASRTEIKQALAGEPSSSVRHSTTLNQEMMYVGLPLTREGRIVGVVRTALPLTRIVGELHAIRVKVAMGGLLIAAITALASLAVSQRISRPLEEMRTAAERFARGDLSYKMAVPESEELAGLAETLNEMAHQLEERIQTVVRQGTEQQAVLASMVEGVLAVDTGQRIISLNKAAAQLLAHSQHDAPGRSLQEVIRNADLRRFVSQSLVSKEPIEGDVVMHGAQDRVLQAHGTALRDGGSEIIGAVIVLNDVTSFRRLESIRRDFVANVSHELKTPITSIKGFVETLLDGALANPEDAQRFLRIIAKQADRLNAIIEDLLSLSKIEQSEDSADLVLERGKIRDVLNAAVVECQIKAGQREVNIRLDCPDDLEVKMSPLLLEQAVGNLLDNAIKYSDPGDTVSLRAYPAESEVVIAVQDEGCGIPAEHLSRIFERFYRVDKGRSRNLGGTGLGLSIVKHIVNVHRGRTTVESTPGKGSTFSIWLPNVDSTADATSRKESPRPNEKLIESR
jgi:two-component system phosphate regulon sensor histidine kinase PhoR